MLPNDIYLKVLDLAIGAHEKEKVMSIVEDAWSRSYKDGQTEGYERGWNEGAAS